MDAPSPAAVIVSPSAGLVMVTVGVAVPPSSSDVVGLVEEESPQALMKKTRVEINNGIRIGVRMSLLQVTSKFVFRYRVGILNYSIASVYHLSRPRYYNGRIAPVL